MDVPPGLKPKDLVGMPWRIAFALQAAGWYLRSDIIWHKPNPMPESVTDRPTSAHEYLFLLAKSARYYYDADAIREAAQDRPQPQPEDKVVYHGAMSVGGNNAYAKGASGYGHNPAGRNKRTVWTVATQPYSGAHFATFPPKLITPCIMAGTSERGCCSSCGAPWVRVVERKGYGSAKGQNKHDMTCNEAGARNRRYARLGGGQAQREVETTGWRPSCTCDAEAVPCTVLDPFGGSGTTAEVAEALGRRWILIELSPTYAELARRRTAQQGLFSR